MPDPPGAVFLAEIREQPHALRALLEHDADFARVAATARERGTSVVRMVGHGSSDNAASYGVYAFGLLPRWTALRDSITLTAYYDAQLELRGSTVVALSQSGRTPDVIDYVTRARRAGAYTVALTNDPGSDLASEADDVLPLEAGPENAVAASKTYLNQVAALGLLAAHAAGEGERFAAGIATTAELLEQMLPDLESRVRRIALPFASVGRMFVVGRGIQFGTAREIALKKLAAVGLGPEVATLSPAELSGGMQKRVALARAIAAEPEIVFFDEPTTGLDPIMADVINRLIVSSVRELGATTVSITHDMVSARRIADRIAMLHKGRIVWQGPASEIDRSDNPFVDQFVNGRAEGPIQMEVRAA